MQATDGRRDAQECRGLGDVFKRQVGQLAVGDVARREFDGGFDRRVRIGDAVLGLVIGF